MVHTDIPTINGHPVQDDEDPTVQRDPYFGDGVVYERWKGLLKKVEAVQSNVVLSPAH